MGIFGECIFLGHSAQVFLTDLAHNGCNVTACCEPVPLECDLALWIGAIGPINATASRNEGRQVRLEFGDDLPSWFTASPPT